MTQTPFLGSCLRALGSAVTVKADLHGLHPPGHIPGLLCIKDADNENGGYAHLIQAHERRPQSPPGALCQTNTSSQTRLHETFFL